MKAVVIGLGARGRIYSGILVKEFQVPIVAVCDVEKASLQYAKEHYQTREDMLFVDENEFFARGKLADVCIVATQDNQHVGHALKALEAGYDLILEKPIATSWEDCNAILQRAKALGRQIFICHVMRYTPFIDCIKKEIDSGKYGKVVTVNLTENVAYWHQAHSYVRGNWRKSKESSPMIIAKSCHDLDILRYLIGEDCTAISSMGGLSYFKAENAPMGATKRCVDCPHKETCAYSAVKYYLRERAERGYFGWPVSVLSPTPTLESITEAVQKGPYGRCVFYCDNDVVDHQVVNMTFTGGKTASFTMTAFSNYMFREIAVHCDHGVIRGDMVSNKLRCYVFGEADTTDYCEPKIIDVDNSLDNDYGHGGGDYYLMKNVVEYYGGKDKEIRSSIENSMQSHLMGFKAEESRLHGGELIKLIIE